ncbi:2TM domain-containing protein [Sungkyunkwania multivorans]|uniref:2TM domain-containing protein n=1 Tax=Sungkyunkwania multivorans TaxID=1173618 RepID=A0ABW3CTQ1_9FLAO
MENLEDIKYKRAKEKVKKIRGFYVHLTVFILVNSLLLVNTEIIPRFWNTSIEVKVSWWGIALWALFLAIHGLRVFGVITFLGKDWEERKIQEFMKEEEETYKSNKF